MPTTRADPHAQPKPCVAATRAILVLIRLLLTLIPLLATLLHAAARSTPFARPRQPDADRSPSSPHAAPGRPWPRCRTGDRFAPFTAPKTRQNAPRAVSRVF